MRANKKNDEAILECYRRLFKRATPEGDFDKLLENAKLNEFGQKVIPFMDYEVSQECLDQTIDEIIKEFKITKRTKDMFKTTIYLGCSPKTKQKEA